MRVLVTGASGLLGLNLCYRKYQEVDIIGVVNRNPLPSAPFQTIQADLLEKNSIDKLIDLAKPDFFIHCAALAGIDRCEQLPDLAYRMNADLPGEIAESCSRHAVGLAYFSTDAVFDGVSGGYKENDPPNPLSVYARSKVAGEQNVLEVFDKVLIPRVNFYGHSLDGERSLAEYFLYHLLQGKRVYGFKDVFFCPLYVTDLVDILFYMIQRGLNGIYHVVSMETLSKYEFGVRLAEKFSLEKKLIEAIPVEEGGLLAPRSHQLTLKVDKLIAAGIEVPGQALGLDRFFKAYHDGYAKTIQSFIKKE